MAISVSTEFRNLLLQSHRIASKVEILQSGSVISLPSGVSFNVVNGMMREDRANNIRRTLNLEVVDPSGKLTPTSLNSILAPYRNEIKPYRGIQTSTGPEYVALGIFGFREVVTNDDSQNLTITIDGFDRSDIIARQRFTTPYSIAAGTAIESAIQALVGSRMGGLTYVLPGTGFTTPAVNYDVGYDPWQACTELANSAGCEVFFDNLGQLVVQSEPDPSTAPVDWTYASGSTSVITQIQRGFAAPLYNHVIESGEGSTIIPPVTASAQDDNASSPTWVGYGDFPLFHVSPLLTTTAQCQAAADARLRKILGATENINFQGICNPALAGGDIIQITQPRVAVNTTAYVVDKVSTPLTADGIQTCAVRARTVGS